MTVHGQVPGERRGSLTERTAQAPIRPGDGTDGVEDRPDSGVTWRALGIGLVLVAVEALWVIHAEYILGSSRLSASHHFPVSVFGPFVLLVAAANLSARMSQGRWALSPSELIVILAMCLAGIVIPSNGITSWLIGSLSAPYYFATPENAWSDFHPYLASWIVPDNLQALTWFYEGLPQGHAIPWGAWVVPVVWWGALGAAFVLASACLATIFRRQWATNERLVYPMLSPALQLTQSADGERLWPGFARSGIFWIGFAISFGTIAWNAISYFLPLVPRIPVQGHWFSMARGFPYTFNTRINFFTVGFSYFANVGVLFSVWFFFLLMNIEMLVMDRVGYTIPLGGGASLPSESNPMITWQSTGAFLVFVGWAVWTARDHIRRVFSVAIGRSQDRIDKGEMVSYRFAVWGALLGGAFIVLWLRAAGMEIAVALVLLLALFAGYLGAAKMVAEIGLLYAPSTLGAESFVVATVGTANMSSGSITVLAFSQNMFCYGRGMVLPPLVQVARLADHVVADRRRVLLSVIAAFALSYLVSVAYTIWLGYTGGAYNFNAYPFTYYSRRIFDRVIYRMGQPWQIDAHRLAFLAIGAVGMGLLTAVRYRISWWTLNPIGFALPRLTWHVFSLFVAWVAKALILKLGGVQLYRRSQPAFVGLLVGYALGVGLSAVVDWIWFPGQGHQIHSW